MKIAITADVHLTSLNKNPERFHALENILDQLIQFKIHQLFIAGDLFDASCEDPAEFEKLLGQDQYQDIQIFIIPGNHDPALSTGTFTLKNIKYITEPELLHLSEEIAFFFLPYRPNTTQGEMISAHQDQIGDKKWILVAHGDYLASIQLINEYENGLYMSLSRREIELYQPHHVFLGHIHAPFDSDKLHYPGSPCGLDITESGIRSFLIYDTAIDRITRQAIETDVIYFQETLTILPLEDEAGYLKNQLEKRISSWGLDIDQMKSVRSRIFIQGYSSNREEVKNTITAYFQQNGIQLNEIPDLRKVKISNDVMRADILSLVQQLFIEMNLPDGDDEPTMDDYIQAAMDQVYGG